MKSSKIIGASLLTILLPAVFFFSCKKEESINPDIDEVRNDGNCQCVGYIKNRLGITGSTANAKDWGPILLARGFYEVSEPQNKDIAVMQPDFGVDRTYGHIAMVGTVNYNSAGTLMVDFVGANQGSNRPIPYEYGCNNVSWWLVTITPQKREHVKFYRR